MPADAPRHRRRSWTAFNGLLQRPTVASVIIGARNEEQLRQNRGAVGWNVTDAQMNRLNEARNTGPAYPYWHEQGFPERIPTPEAAQ